MKFNDRGNVISRDKLFRNTRRGKVLGVCAGLADFYNTDRHIVRLLVILSALFFTKLTLCVLDCRFGITKTT